MNAAFGLSPFVKLSLEGISWVLGERLCLKHGVKDWGDIGGESERVNIEGDTA